MKFSFIFTLRILVGFYIGLSSLVPYSTYAARVSIDTLTDASVISTQKFLKGQDFLVSIVLDTERDNTNAIEGSVVFPKNLVEIREIREGNSKVNFWVEKPHIVDFSAKEKGIRFSGIIPGGISGGREHIFSVVFHALESGDGSLRSEQIRVLRNDGTGGTVKVSLQPLVFSIVAPEGATIPTVPSMIDTEAPENFVPAVVQDKELFEGKYFLVFATQDKGVGIDHYEVREGLFGDFVTAESPYILEDQTLEKKLYVKAFDKNGNSIVATLDALHPVFWYQDLTILSILIGALVIGIILFRKVWRKFTH